MTLLGNEIENFLWYIGSFVHYKEGDARIKSAYKEIELSKEKIKFYIAKGANPNHIDNNKNSYESLLKHKRQEQLEKHKAYMVLEKILFPNRPQSSK